MHEAPYPSLREFAESWSERDPAAAPPYAHPEGPPLEVLETAGLRRRLEDVLDTVVALQRAQWLQEGVWVGPRAMPEVYRDLLACARTLRIAVPPAVIEPCAGGSQGVFGTDGRAYLRLSSFVVPQSPSEERRFHAGRLCGHVHARHVTWGTLYALLVDQDGLRKIAGRALGPALDVVLGPLSLGARVALSRWHRAAEITADRAGLLCAGDSDVAASAAVDAAGRALLRVALGVRPGLSPDEYLAQLRATGGAASPGRWAEVLHARPWLHKRLRALALFARSEVWVGLGHEAVAEPLLSRAELDAQTTRLLQVG